MRWTVRDTVDSDSGFTLVELLVVIAILGVLAGVVVFSIAGVNDTSQAAACKTEAATVRAAQETYYAKNKNYTNDAGLVAAKLLSGTPLLVDTNQTVTVPATSYTVVWQDANCGTVGAAA